MVSAEISQLMEKAKQELPSKTIFQIQVETARTWAARSCVAAMFSDGEAARQNSNDALTWMLNAIEYGHEALEHAALSGDNNLLHEVQSALSAFGVKTA
jgi:hypothetical protein